MNKGRERGQVHLIEFRGGCPEIAKLIRGPASCRASLPIAGRRKAFPDGCSGAAHLVHPLSVSAWLT